MRASVCLATYQLLSSLTTVAAETVRYEPSVTTLRGKVVLESFAGPPNFESVAAGDSLERHWILKLGHPVKVAATHNDPTEVSYEQVREIQLVCRAGCRQQFGFVEGKTETLVGTLYPAISAQHHKDVLMTVKSKR